MNWYHTIERELVHVQNAIQILEETREKFPPGTVISEPKYWCTRLQTIRDLAERHNHRELRTKASELLARVEKLRR